MKAGDACWEGSGRYFLQIAQVQQQVTACRFEAPSRQTTPDDVIDTGIDIVYPNQVGSWNPRQCICLYAREYETVHSTLGRWVSGPYSGSLVTSGICRCLATAGQFQGTSLVPAQMVCKVLLLSRLRLRLRLRLQLQHAGGAKVWVLV